MLKEVGLSLYYTFKVAKIKSDLPTRNWSKGPKLNQPNLPKRSRKVLLKPQCRKRGPQITIKIKFNQNHVSNFNFNFFIIPVLQQQQLYQQQQQHEASFLNFTV